MIKLFQTPLVCLLIGGLSPSGYSQTAEAANAREAELLERIRRLEERLSALESREPVVSSPAPPPGAAGPATTPAGSTVAAAPAPQSAASILGGTTFNVNLDGYYGYNFNRPVGRVNLLRAYDVTSNNMTVNQAGIVIERAPNIDAGRRYGL